VDPKVTSQVFKQVAELDARGEHDQAINLLSQAVIDGDHVAKCVLGKRLFVGDRSPYLPREGAQFILEAAQTGVADAVSVVAVFQATGIFQQKSWEDSLNTLTHAAILGSSIAREQLILLANKGEPAENPGLLSNNEDAHWQEIRSSISIDDWTREVEGEIISDSPEVKTFRNLLSPQICRWLIRLSKERLKPALVYDAKSQRNYVSETRTNSIAEFNLMENELLHFLIQQKMSAASGIPMQQMEGTAILNYQPGEEISPHFDFVDPNMENYHQEIATNGQRIMTFLIYLNDDYEGGDTVFTELDLSFKGKTGDAMYFINSLPDGSADTRTRHSGTPPTSGEKWIVSQFIRNREVKYILD